MFLIRIRIFINKKLVLVKDWGAEAENSGSNQRSGTRTKG